MGGSRVQMWSSTAPCKAWQRSMSGRERQVLLVPMMWVSASEPYSFVACGHLNSVKWKEQICHRLLPGVVPSRDNFSPQQRLLLLILLWNVQGICTRTSAKRCWNSSCFMLLLLVPCEGSEKTDHMTEAIARPHHFSWENGKVLILRLLCWGKADKNLQV